MTVSEVRDKYLKFFEKRNHKIIPSASLVPENDPTTLFTSSGMQPLVPYLLGETHPEGRRLVNSQKSFRAEDIEEVGDNRHTTFFEMLGNWSLGDYFKKEQLPWFFEFLTNTEEGLGLDPKKLYVTVFAGDEKNNIPRDEESAGIWVELFKNKGIEAKAIFLGSEQNGGEVGMQAGRIFYYDAKKNWWSRSGVPDKMPAGEPGGPDSEVFYEFVEIEHDSKFGKNCHPNCDCGRFMEIGNSVFMEYKKLPDGSFEKLPQQNVDFGGGLERLTAATINSPDVFKIDVFESAVRTIEKAFDRSFQDRASDYRVIADHYRAAVFMLADGVSPSNKDRGYILRRLIRRASYKFYKESIQKDKIELQKEVIASFIETYQNYFPGVKENSSEILSLLEKEIRQFYGTLQMGLDEFNKMIGFRVQRTPDNASAFPPQALSGKDAFTLFSTFGLPLDLIKEKSIEAKVNVDENEFWEEFHKHQELSRTASAGTFKGGLADHSEAVVKLHTATHLMNAALRKVLGDHVWQKGSNITSERTRFDFTHNAKMTDEEKKQVEDLVNGWIKRDLKVRKDIISREEAEKLGAIGVFGEKYGETVSVYSVFDPVNKEIISREFCGGPHVEHTGDMGVFHIVKEEAVAAGVRRLKAVLQ